MARVPTIDWVEDIERENAIRIQQGGLHLGPGWKLRAQRALVSAQSWLTLGLTGMAIGLIAAMLNVVTPFLADLRTGFCTTNFYLNESFCCLGESTSCENWHEWTSFSGLSYLVYIAISVLFAAAACFLVLEYAPTAAGSGISEIKCIVSGYLIQGMLGFSTLAIKALALPLTIASGFSVGKEGPSVHYATCVGNIIGRFFSKYRVHNSKRRELLTACTAAGVAVAFGSPIGGVLFSIEEIYPGIQVPTIFRSYFCCLVATGVLSLLNPFRNGKLVLFSVTYDQPWHLFEIPFFIILGLFGGYMGHFIIKWNLRVQAMRKQYLKDHAMQEVLILTILTAAICYYNDFLTVDMTKSMEILFNECKDSTQLGCNPSNQGRVAISLFIALVLRTVLVIISYGAKVPAGIFVPSMAIGALFGRLVGTMVWALYRRFPDSPIFSGCLPGENCINPGAYAFLGAGALLSGVMHITVSVVVIMFELTGALVYIIPSMIVIGVTKTISERFGAGIADMAIVANNYPYLSDELELEGVVDQVMQMPKLIVLGVPMPKPLEHQVYPVLDLDGYLLGSVHASEVRDQVIEDTLRINRSPTIVAPGTQLDWIYRIFTDMGPSIIFVVDQGKLIGLLTRRDLVNQFKITLSSPSELEHRAFKWIASKLGS